MLKINIKKEKSIKIYLYEGLLKLNENFEKKTSESERDRNIVET